MVFFDNQDLHLTNSQYTNLTLNSSLEGKERVYIENIQPLLDALNTDLNIHYFLIYFIMMAIYLFTIKIILDKNIQFDFIKKYTMRKLIHYIASKMISLWKTSINFWIYLGGSAEK